MSNGFFINRNLTTSGSGSLVNIDGDDVTVNIPLDLYIDENNNVFVGSENNNAMLIHTLDNNVYVRKVV